MEGLPVLIWLLLLQVLQQRGGRQGRGGSDQTHQPLRHSSTSTPACRKSATVRP